MPAFRASRGEVKRTGSPSTASVPSSGGWTPERVLMSVDLPAPLSPSRQLISPARTARETPSRATTAPKYFEMLRASRSGGPSGEGVAPAYEAWAEEDIVIRCSFRSAQAGEAAPDEVVQDDRGKEQPTRRDLVPVGVDRGVDDADLGHPESQRPE